MNLLLLRTAVVGAFISITVVSLFAGHPLMNDDAGIVDGKTCQLETWMERRSDSATYWILPACNFTGNLELTVGGAWTDEAHRTRNSQVVLQGKSIFKSLNTNGWSWSSRGYGMASKRQLK